MQISTWQKVKYPFSYRNQNLQKYITKFQKVGPTSHFRGSQQIDGIWYTRNIVPTSTSMCPFHFCVGDNRAYVIDFQMKTVLGDLDIPLCSTKKRRLMFSFPIILQRNLERTEHQFTLNKIHVKIQQLNEQWHTLDYLLMEIQLNTIDELETCMLINSGGNVVNIELAKLPILQKQTKTERSGTSINYS